MGGEGFDNEVGWGLGCLGKFDKMRSSVIRRRERGFG